MPTVSVIMSVYNGGAYLAPAIDSVLAQTFGDFEFIIVDDGSTDDSSPMLDRYANGDPRVRVHRHANRGLTASLNVAIALSQGEFVARMDPDDISLPHRFELQVAYLRAHPECGLVGSRVMQIDDRGRPICPIDVPLTHEAIEQTLLTLSDLAFCHPAIMVRRDAVMKIGGYDERFLVNQDHDLGLRLAEVTRLANLHDTLLLYRRHFAAACFAKQERQWQTLGVILAEACARRGIENLPIPKYPHTRLSPAQVHRQWSGSAIGDGQVWTGLVHAAAAVRLEPTRRDNWALLWRAMRRMPRWIVRRPGIVIDPAPVPDTADVTNR